GAAGRAVFAVVGGSARSREESQQTGTNARGRDEVELTAGAHRLDSARDGSLAAQQRQQTGQTHASRPPRARRQARYLAVPGVSRLRPRHETPPPGRADGPDGNAEGSDACRCGQAEASARWSDASV